MTAEPGTIYRLYFDYSTFGPDDYGPVSKDVQRKVAEVCGGDSRIETIRFEFENADNLPKHVATKTSFDCDDYR